MLMVELAKYCLVGCFPQRHSALSESGARTKYELLLSACVHHIDEEFLGIVVGPDSQIRELECLDHDVNVKSAKRRSGRGLVIDQGRVQSKRGPGLHEMGQVFVERSTFEFCYHVKFRESVNLDDLLGAEVGVVLADKLSTV